MRLRLSSLALAAAFLFAVAGLVAADYQMSESRRARVRQAATESAAQIEAFLQLHAQALQVFRGLYVDPDHAVTAADFQALVEVISEHAPAFRRIWFADSAGVVRFQHLFGAPSPPIPTGLDLDTLSRLGVRELARRGRLSDRTLVSRVGWTFTDDRGFFILQPISIGGRFHGFAGGTTNATSVLARLHPRDPPHGLRHVILAGADTVAVDTSAVPAVRHVQAEVVRVPGGGEWRVVVEGSAAGWQRTIVWTVGLFLLSALFVGLVHERRQGVRLAERSAELERLSVELLRANRAKSEFLHNISHELRTPLNAIVGFTEMLQDGVYGDLAPRQGNPVGRIASAATHLRHLVDQVLDLAKLTAGRLEIQAEPVDLRAIVLDVASEVEPLAEARGLALSLGVSATIPRLRTDATHLRQILLNILGNAIKYTDRGGIAVRARLASDDDAPPGLSGAESEREPRQWVAMAVTDTGVGIAAEDFERVFDEFEQVNAGSRGDSMRRGTGLGLPISRRLARLLGGDITLDSQPGKGSTFTLWLPIDPAEPAVTTAEHRVAAEVAGRSD